MSSCAFWMLVSHCHLIKLLSQIKVTKVLYGQYISLVREYGPEGFEENIKIAYGDELNLNQPVGCGKCNNKGYRGRMALHELLTGTDEIKLLIQNMGKVDEIRAQSIKDGMTTLKQDGIEKIFSGYLDLLQVRKVCIR